MIRPTLLQTPGGLTDLVKGSTAGNTVSVVVMNQGKQSASGMVMAQTTVDGVVHSASAKVSLAAGQSVTIQLILGTITDDINPQNLQLFTITDDINPQGR